ncbi:protein of unknown function [Nitrosomonas sp. PY1]|uniref:DUF3293 domain-containing protein n=1 Tax=Nitrosomonas sp. PY1 TaxID=1803906 RepID=UPI001FC80DDE|nr:DUF3293 domain-containing protein [Nitrosomonas sp. PY1]GKS68452.1 protein of unknown function [Nitrosomonas sp. PY1]
MIDTSNSIIDKKLIASYYQTQYWVSIEREKVVVFIDRYSERIKSLLIQFGASCAAIVTAYNSYSQLSSENANCFANELLRNFLAQNHYHFLESLNVDPTQTWPPEKSFFVFGLEFHAAQNIGRQFDQNAIVWMRHDAIARLILLR